MQIKIFNLSAFADEEEQKELNLFLDTNKIFSFEKEFVNNGQQSFWSIIITYGEQKLNNAKVKKAKIDYKEVLDSDTFQVYDKLRSLRKQIAEKEGVPIYLVFTNDELAKIAQLDTLNLEGIRAIKGIGKKRVDIYGQKLIDDYYAKN